METRSISLKCFFTYLRTAIYSSFSTAVMNKRLSERSVSQAYVSQAWWGRPSSAAVGLNTKIDLSVYLSDQDTHTYACTHSPTQTLSYREIARSRRHLPSTSDVSLLLKTPHEYGVCRRERACQSRNTQRDPKKRYIYVFIAPQRGRKRDKEIYLRCWRQDDAQIVRMNEK